MNINRLICQYRVNNVSRFLLQKSNFAKYLMITSLFFLIRKIFTFNDRKTERKIIRKNG